MFPWRLLLRFLSLFALITAVAILSHTTTAQTDPGLAPPYTHATWPFQPTDVPAFDPPAEPYLQSRQLPWSKVVFQSLRDGNWEIYRSNDDGSDTRRLTHNLATDMHPRLNRGGTKTIYASRVGDNYELFVIDQRGHTRLTQNNSDDVYPAWSPDSSKIAFQAYRDGQPEIYVMNADGSGVTRLTNHPAYDGYPTWSPDGSKIAFMSNRSGGYRIHVMNADGSNVIQLSNQPNSIYPAWSPDGNYIAYSADGNQDGWLEVWLMTADGGSQQPVKLPGDLADTWVSGWSPDGEHIIYTHIYFINYQGQWYWRIAYVEGINLGTRLRLLTLPSDGTVWNLDWQTLDTTTPSVSFIGLPIDAPNLIPVQWTGSDSGGSGLAGYDVQVMVGDSGVWQNWLTDVMDTSAYYEGVAGETYRFRVRSHDGAWNRTEWVQGITRVETFPPETAIEPLPPFTRFSPDGFHFYWSGHDPGLSGIRSYDVEYRINDGAWQHSFTGQPTQDVHLFDTNLANLGDKLYFRSRGVDYADNQEAWPAGNGDTATTLYQWGVSGRAYDNTGIPLADVETNILPTTFTTITNGLDGHYAGYTLDAPDAPYSVSWQHDHLGSLPTTFFSSAQDGRRDIYFPPLNNLWPNGDFEDDSPELLNDTSAMTTINPHTGQRSLLLGSADFFAPAQQLSDSAEYAHAPAAALDEVGNLHVVWATYAGQNSLHYAQRNPTGAWSDVVSIAGVGAVESPKMHIVGQTIHLLFSSSSVDWGENLYYMTRNSDGVWGTPYQISPTKSTDYQFAVGTNGEVHVVWRSRDDWRFYYSRRAANGTWDIPRALTSQDSDANDPAIVVDAHNQVHIVWGSLGYFYDGASLELVTRHADGQWANHPSITTAGASEYKFVQLVMDANGRLHVVWQDQVLVPYLGYKVALFYASYDGQRWSDPVSLLTMDTTFDRPARAQMKSDAMGNIHLLLRHDQRVLYQQIRATGQWDAPVTIYDLSENEGAQFITTDLAVQGNVVTAAWIEQSAPQTRQIGLVQKTGDAAWGAALFTPSSGLLPTVPLLRMNDSQQIHLIWEDMWGAAPYGGVSKVHYIQQLVAPTAVSLTYQETITLPLTMSEAVLAYMYQLRNGAAVGNEGLKVSVTDVTNETTLVAHHVQDEASWSHHWADLSAWRGEVVTVTFSMQQEAERPLAQLYLDDVSVGTAWPDVWVTADSGTGVRDQHVQHTLTYGNDGGAIATGTWLTYTLPSGLAFVSANPMPLSTNPLVWELGDVSADSVPLTVTVTVEILPTAVAFTTLTAAADISTDRDELQTFNNQAQRPTYFGVTNYLPAVAR